ncbi:MAG: PspC domain-containing protein [Bacteroidetes bacterium]|nr:PspC domain-containing protein [Bacteroidota bacterium]
MNKRLYRNTSRKMIGGVCSGIADYFSIDPVLVRLLFIILVLHNGIGILAYVILWIVVPQQRASTATYSDTDDLDSDEVLTEQRPATEQSGQQSSRSSFFGGIALIVIGLLFLLDNFIPGFGLHHFWPVLLIVLGGAMLWNSSSRSRNENEEVSS